MFPPCPSPFPHNSHMLYRWNGHNKLSIDVNVSFQGVPRLQPNSKEDKQLGKWMDVYIISHSKNTNKGKMVVFCCLSSALSLHFFPLDRETQEVSRQQELFFNWFFFFSGDLTGSRGRHFFGNPAGWETKSLYSIFIVYYNINMSFLTSFNMIGELKASSLSPSFIDLDPGLMKVSLWLRLGYLPKVASNSFCSQLLWYCLFSFTL